MRLAEPLVVAEPVGVVPRPVLNDAGMQPVIAVPVVVPSWPGEHLPGPPRICLITDSLNPSGMGQHMLALATSLRQRYRLALACPVSAGGQWLLEAASRLGVAARPVGVSSASPGPAAAAAGELEWLSGFDVVHVHAGIAFEGSGPVELARRAGVPAVVRSEHQPYGVRTAQQAERYRRAQQAVDRVVCVSQGVADTFARAGVPSERLVVVRNGVPAVPVVDPAPVRRRLGLTPGAPVVLTPARFTAQKGHQYLLPAAASVARQCPDVQFLWSGAGPTRSRMQQEVAAAGLTERVRFLPGQESIAELLAVASVLALPSLYEGMPLVVLEAMSASVPVVATRVCGTDELLVDGATGRLVPACDDEALARALLELLADPLTAQRYAQAAYRDYQHVGTDRRMAEQTAAIYDDLLATAWRAPAGAASHGSGAGLSRCR